MYAFNHEDRAFTPDGVAAFPPSQSEDHNRQVEAQQLESVRNGCARVFAYCAITGTPESRFHTGHLGWSPGVIRTWLGTEIGLAMFGPKVRDNFGGHRRAVRMTTAQGTHYHGWFFESSGDYCRLKRCKDRKAVSA